MSNETPKKINCVKCVHYAVTWNPKLPKCCNFYGFKSVYTPSSVVLRTSGSECMGFKEKNSNA